MKKQTPKELFDAVKLQYAHCQTYRDKGEIFGPEGSLKFSTYFARPNNFRFDWTYNSPTAKTESFTANDETSLIPAIKAATSISQGILALTCSLLTPHVLGLNLHSLGNIADLKLFVSEEEHGELYHKMLSSSSTQKYEVWTRARDNAICKQLHDSIANEASDKALLEAIRHVHPASEGALREYLKNIPEKERHTITAARYDLVVFDEALENSLFQNSPNNPNNSP